MSVIVTDTGFQSEDWVHGFQAPETLAAGSDAPAVGLDLGNDVDPASLQGRLDGIDLIRIAFPGPADGRGFTIARRLRLMGYQGRLRAHGHVLADQYAMARRSGFDEVEISPELAERQPEDQWLARANWRTHDYQSRLRA